MKKKKIVVIGAHPDDPEGGMGGTLAKHSYKGDDVHIILCTLGGVLGDPKEREDEAKVAARLLNAKLKVLDYPVSKLNQTSIEFVNVLKEAIERFYPDRLYTHSLFDYHQVHVAVSKSALKAAGGIKQILFYEYVSSTTPEFKPNAYVDISKYIELKVKCVEAHKSQTNKFYMHPNVIRSLANTRYVWGKVGPNPNGFAEAFVIHKFIV
jgi:LmbE family N-acetylglucosaminyl deacetylase